MTLATRPRRPSHPQLDENLLHYGIPDVDPVGTRYHGARSPILFTPTQQGPFGPCTLTRDEYLALLAQEA